MASRARCGDCGESVLVSSATPVVRSSGVVLICASCQGSASGEPPRPARRKPRTNALLGASITVSPINRAQRARPALSSANQPNLDDHEPDDDDFDYDDFEIGVADVEIEAEPAFSSDDKTSAGLARASTSGAIEATKKPRRDDTLPPPVVISD